jgi:hypothetical protein
MKISRRDFVHASCAIAATTLVRNPLDAASHGIAPAGLNLSRLNINVPSTGQLYLNLAKNFFFSLLPGSFNQTSDGYPANGILATGVNANVGFPSGYYGKFVWKWTGTGSMESVSGPIIVYSGGTNIFGIRPAASGDLSGNIIIAPDTGTAGITNPRVIFNYGWNIQQISDSGLSNGSGGNLALVTVKSGFFSSFYTGTTVNVTGTGTSQDNTTTTITFQSPTTFTLDGSTYVSGSGVAGTAVFALTSASWAFFGGQNFNNMTNLVICKADTSLGVGDETDITNGLIFDTVLVNQFRYLMQSGGRGNPGWLRFMDSVVGGRGYEGDFANRMPVTAMNYNTSRFVNNYWAGTISNTSDAFACSDPATSVWDSVNSRYFDGAVVQGSVASANTTGTPTLAVGGHTTVPIFGPNLQNQILGIPSAPTAAGQNLVWTFNAGGASYLNGGSNYVFTYTTVTADVGNYNTFAGNLITALTAGLHASTTNDAVQPSLSFITKEIYIYAPTLQANGTTGGAHNVMVVTYSGATACSIYRIPTSGLSQLAAGNATFIYNALLGGFFATNFGLGQGIPLEAIVDLCNRVGAHCWFNWMATTGAYVTAVTNFFANNLAAGLKFGTETGNEIWNSGASPYAQYLALGTCLGWSIAAGNNPQFSYGGLRTKQYAVLSRAAWAAAGRAASDHYVLSMGQIGDRTLTNNIPTSQWMGTSLDPSSFPLYGSYGGLNGSGAVPTGSASYHLAGNRPIDTTNAIGCAPYWGSPWLGGAAAGNAGIAGTVAQNAPMLQASLDFTNGNFSTAYTSLVNQFNGTTLRSDTTVGIPFGPDSALFVTGFGFIASYITIFKAFETMAASFDSAGHGIVPKLAIMHYEGGPNWAMGADGNNGVNSVNSTDINALATQFANLGWSGVGAYLAGGTSGNNTTDLTTLATQIITMAQAWKHDVSYKNLIKTSYYQAFYNVSGINREIHPGQYGYNASQWGLFPGDYSAGNPYQNYNAIQEWNA